MFRGIYHERKCHRLWTNKTEHDYIIPLSLHPSLNILGFFYDPYCSKKKFKYNRLEDSAFHDRMSLAPYRSMSMAINACALLIKIITLMKYYCLFFMGFCPVLHFCQTPRSTDSFIIETQPCNIYQKVLIYILHTAYRPFHVRRQLCKIMINVHSHLCASHSLHIHYYTHSPPPPFPVLPRGELVISK